MTYGGEPNLEVLLAGRGVDPESPKARTANMVAPPWLLPSPWPAPLWSPSGSQTGFTPKCQAQP